jgi:site-specific DNA recombinase
MEKIVQLKYCLYARKSSESDERQAMSIDSQIKEMTAMADREGLNIVEIKQESFSAKQSGHRPVFNELLHDLRNGKFEAILTWAPDRMSRNAGDLGSLVDLMDMNKLQRIRTFGQSFSNTPNEKFLLMILCSQAKLENDNRGINVKRGIRAKCEMGWRPGAAPIGYINRSFGGVKDIVLDNDRAPFVKEMFERSGLMNQSGRTIKDWLDSIGFTTKSGAQLSLSQIYRILTNPFYYGYLLWLFCLSG